MIENEKSIARAEIQLQLSRSLCAGFEYAGIMYPCDPGVEIRVNSLLNAFANGGIPANDTVIIRDSLNGNRIFTLEELKLFANALTSHVRALYTICWAAKDAIV